MTRIEKYRYLIEEKKRQHDARQAHFPLQVAELKRNVSRNLISIGIYQKGLAEVEAYKARSKVEFEEIQILEQKIEAEVDKIRVR